jgi:aminodeoxyfutalosine deaminase
MPERPSETGLATLPKVELHVHLGGTITEATAAELARRHGTDLAAALPLVAGRYPGRYGDFAGFLETYFAANALVRTPDDLETVAAAFAEHQAAQSIAWSEVIVTTGIYVRNGVEPAAMWRALRAGLAAAGPRTRIGIIVDAIRDLGRQDAEAAVRLVEDADAPIVGLCLTGTEGTVPTSEFTLLRQAADRLGLGLEVHAGETGPPASVVEALDVLGADRIGHGVAAIRDPALMERLVREAVPLDVCPSSNVCTSLFPSLEAHPFAAFWRAGVAMTISSDDPPFFGTTLTDELRDVARIAGLTRHDLAELQRRAGRVSFAPPDVRRELVERIDRWEAAATP